MKRQSPSHHLARRLVSLAFLATVFLAFAPTAGAQVDSSGEQSTVAQEEDSPYSALLTEVEPPGWLQALGPLAELPVWASAAVISAAIAGFAFVVPITVRWLWSLQATRDSET